eukprot:181315_1
MTTQLEQSVVRYIEHEARKAGIYLPSSVIQLCIKMIGLNSFVWHIDDPKLLNQILFAKWKDEFHSDVFQIAKFNWQVELCPNGFSQNGQGCCAVYLKLLAMPYSWKSIFCHFHAECPEIQSKIVWSRSYKRAGIRGCEISSFEDLKASCAKELTFVITIRIARITLKEDNKILFQMRMQRQKYKKNAQLQWKIDEETMTKLKSFKKGKGISSDILNNIWCLQLYPNGQWCSTDGYVLVGLWLCGLPAN